MAKPIHTIICDKDDRVFIHIMEGHFVSSHSHMNYYVGTSDIKHNHEVSTDAAMLMAQYYIERGINVDTVLCLYETQSLGAYLAHELSRPSMMSPNPSNIIYTLGPEYDAAGNIIFRDNLKKMINDKNIVILISCISSGITIEKAIESINYYGGTAVGITSIFSAIEKVDNIPINTLFSLNDIPNYKVYDSHSCDLCNQGLRVDAISNGYGYSTI